jgi:CheY-like chemotaxis protein
MHKLLLADDSVTIQRVIELTFSGEDVQVLAVNDGEQAIARIPLERPDVVLADIGMPRKGGYEVSAFVKGRPDLAHIPVLLLAGAFEPVDQARAEQVGADGVLIKPFEPRQVIERVKELLALVPQAPARDAVPQAPARDAVPQAPVTDTVPRAPIELPEPPAPESPPIDVPPAVVAEAPLPGPPAAADVQSLDDLFESLNQALGGEPAPTETTPPEPAPAASILAPEPQPIPALEQPVPAAEREPEPLMLEPPAPFEPLAAPMTNGTTTTLDDYFDRLSAAFEQSVPPASRPVPQMPERFEDLASASQAQPAPRADEWPAQEWLAPATTAVAFDRRDGETNPILEAVTALMSYGTEPEAPRAAATAWTAPPLPAPIAPIPPPASSQAMVDAIAERVLARLVPEVAESLRRLVQQELERSH